MSMQAIMSGAYSVPVSFAAPTRNHPLLRALKNIEYGRLVLGTPDGRSLEFCGREQGHSAYLKLYDWDVLDDLMSRGEMGFAEAYIDRRWESPDMPALLTFALFNTGTLKKFMYGNLLQVWLLRARRFLNGNSLKGSRRNVMAHYDLGNEFYALWLDDSMTYSCGLFEGDETRTLEEAQKAKYHRILRKLNAKPGEHILEIGCGWGGFAEEAARRGIRVTGVTLSERQASYARNGLCDAGLDNLAAIKLEDYRKVTGRFDHVVSVGMFEHVGEKYWPVYFSTVKKLLKPGGTAMIQSITLDDYLFETLHDYSGFMEQVIFPGGHLPSKPRFRKAAEAAGLACKEIYAFGQDYARTTREWLTRFEARKAEIKALGYDEAFLRLWRFYLSSCIASFTSRRTEVMQVELVHAA